MDEKIFPKTAKKESLGISIFVRNFYKTYAKNESAHHSLSRV